MAVPCQTVRNQMSAIGLLTISMSKLQLTQMVPSECVSAGAVIHCLFQRYFYGLRHKGLNILMSTEDTHREIQEI